MTTLVTIGPEVIVQAVCPCPTASASLVTSTVAVLATGSPQVAVIMAQLQANDPRVMSVEVLVAGTVTTMVMPTTVSVPSSGASVLGVQGSNGEVIVVEGAQQPVSYGGGAVYVGGVQVAGPSPVAEGSNSEEQGLGCTSCGGTSTIPLKSVSTMTTISTATKTVTRSNNAPSFTANDQSSGVTKMLTLFAIALGVFAL